MTSTTPISIRAVIADWCGTLERNTASRIEALQNVCSDLKLKALDRETCKKISGMSQFDTFELICTLNDHTIDRKTFDKNYYNHRQYIDTGLIMSAHTKAWLMQHTKFCLFTNGSRATVNKNIEKYQLHGCFQQITTPDEFPAKPNPEMLKFISKALKIPLQECLVVGDHPFDLLAAEAAGAPCVIVETGLSNPDDFIDLPPALAHVASINDVPKLIEQINTVPNSS